MTQPWSLKAEDRIDAGFVLRSLEPVGQHILRWLADRPGERFSCEHLATVFSEELAQSQPRRTVREHIDRANEISTSFGRVRLVDIDDDICLIGESAALIVPVALDWLAASAVFQRIRVSERIWRESDTKGDTHQGDELPGPPADGAPLSAARTEEVTTGLAEAISDIVIPAVRAVFREGEVSAIQVRFEPALEGGSIVVTLTAEDEDFHDVVVQGNVADLGLEEWRERLRSNLVDFVAESRFGWGQNRDVPPAD